MRHLLLLLPLLLLSCSTSPSQTDQQTIASDTIKAPANDTLATAVSTDTLVNEDYATYYVVIADTGLNYDALNQKMYRLQKLTNLGIDTMARHYNRKKNLIALADDDEDDIYAGDYYPRRDTGEFLSLEYLSQYQDKGRNKTIALVTGIYETAAEASHALALLKPSEPKAFSVKSLIYTGCMH